MNPSRRQDQLHQRLRETLDRLGRAHAETDRRRGEPPRPGDLFVFSATADFDVQWTVLERDPRDAGRLLVVPADVNPLVGSADVAVPAQAPFGAMTLRCRFGVWLGEAAFDPDRRTGFLTSEDLERARRKWQEVDRGVLLGSAAERETDAEAEYRDWAQDVLAKAQAALSVAGKAADEAARSLIFANGIDGHTGGYLAPPTEVSRIAAWARGERVDPSVLRLLKIVHHAAGQPHLGLPGGVDPRDPRQAGWGVVFHTDESPAVRDALAPLIEHRRGQVGGRARVLEYREGDDWREWLARHGVGADEVQPAKVPYYLLLVGPPTRIPFELQSLLGVQHAIGRLSFDETDDYRRYAESVIDAETSPPHGRRMVVFGPRHPEDPVTRATADLLVKPLMAEPSLAERRGFSTTRLWGGDATKARLLEVLHGRHNGEEQPPALVFCAAHGLGWPQGHVEQTARQGALLCQDWPGLGRVDERHHLGAGDVDDDARVHGMIALLLTSYGAGTPERDVHLHEPGEPPPRIAEKPFVARLPQRLLAHPRGGALAVVGLVDRVWGHAIAATAAEESLQPFRNVLGELLEGSPVGHAVRDFNQRQAALSINLNDLLRKMGFGARVSDREVATAWIERNQAQSYIVLGDPAVRLRVEGAPG